MAERDEACRSPVGHLLDRDSPQAVLAAASGVVAHPNRHAPLHRVLQQVEHAVGHVGRCVADDRWGAECRRHQACENLLARRRVRQPPHQARNLNVIELLDPSTPTREPPSRHAVVDMRMVLFAVDGDPRLAEVLDARAERPRADPAATREVGLPPDRFLKEGDEQVRQSLGLCAPAQSPAPFASRKIMPTGAVVTWRQALATPCGTDPLDRQATRGRIGSSAGSKRPHRACRQLARAIDERLPAASSSGNLSRSTARSPTESAPSSIADSRVDG